MQLYVWQAPAAIAVYSTWRSKMCQGGSSEMNRSS